MIGLTAVRQTLDFGELMREHRSMVFSVAWHFLHDRDLAEEIAQDVFLSLHKNLAGIETPAHAGYWLRKVAVQRAIDAARKRSRRPQVALEDVAEPSVRPAAGRPDAGRDVAEADRHAARNAAHGDDFAVPGRPGPSGDCRNHGHPVGNGEESHSTVAGSASREAGAPRRGRTVMDWLEQELTQALARKEPAAGFDGRVRARMHRRPQWLAIAATILVMIGGGEAWRHIRESLPKSRS